MDAKGYKAAMTYSNLKKLLSTLLLLLCSLLLMVRPAYTAPVVLEDKVMDQITAGNTNEGGGVVVGQSSKAIANRTSGLALGGEAQQNATGLNIVNSTESAVANVANIWDGNGVSATKEGSDTNSEVKINQVNNITQEQLRSATVSGYIRSEADHTEILNRSGSVSYSSKIVDHHDVTSISDTSHTLITGSYGNVNTLIEFNIDDDISFSGNLGVGMAATGHTDINFEGGSAEIAAAIGQKNDSSNKAKITSAGDGKSLVAEGLLTLVTRVELPSMDIVIDGAGCAVALGSCDASSTTYEYTDSYSDNSTLDIIENHQSGQSAYSEVQTSIHRSPFELKNARAEYIVIDNSTLELNSDIMLELSDSAQKDTKGMNIVNAIGSNVANSTNISRTRNFEGSRSKLVLNQFNTVQHGH